MSASSTRWVSPFSPAECAERLGSAIDREGSILVSLSAYFGSKPVIGRVSAGSLRLRRRIAYRNSFQSFLFATLEPAVRGTRITAEVKMHPFVRGFMFVWLGFVVFFWGLSAFAVVASATGVVEVHGSHGWLGLLAPLVMGAFGVGLVKFGRYLARDEERFLLDFVTGILDARPEESRFPSDAPSFSR